MAIFMAILPGMAESYSTVATSNPYSKVTGNNTATNVTLNNVDWSVTFDCKSTSQDVSWIGGDASADNKQYAQFGTSSNNLKKLTFTTAGFNSYKIDKIRVRFANASKDARASVIAKVGDVTSTSTAAKVFSSGNGYDNFTNAEFEFGVSGNITIEFSNTATKGGLILRWIEVQYSTSGAGDTQAAPGFVTITPASGSIDTETAISIAADPDANPAATITYTIDGGAEQTYSAPFTLTEGEHTVKATATNSEGSISETATYTVTKYVAPATTTATITFTNHTNDANWGFSATNTNRNWTSDDGKFTFPATAAIKLESGSSGTTYPTMQSGGMRIYYSSRSGITVNAPKGYTFVSLSYTLDDSKDIKVDGNKPTNKKYTFTGSPKSFLMTAASANATIKTLTIVLKADGPAVPADPVFSVAEGDVEYNTQVTVSSEGATSLTYTIDYNDNEKADVIEEVDGDSYTFNVDYDCQVSVLASNDAGDSKEVSNLYYIIRPTVTFDPAAGEIAKGTKVKFSAPKASKYVYSVLDENIETLVEETTIDGEFGEYTVTQNATISVKAYLPNGYANEHFDEATYTVVVPADPATPTFSIADGSAVTPGTKVTIHSANAQKLAITEYSITGHPMEPIEIEGDTYTITIDRMHRRFSAVGSTADALNPESDPAEAFFNLKGRQAVSGESFALIKSAADLYDGMEFLMGVEEHTDSKGVTTNYNRVMSTSSNTKSRIWYGTDAEFADGIVTPPADALTLVLEDAGNGKWLIKTKEAITFRNKGEKPNVTEVGYFYDNSNVNFGDQNYLQMSTEPLSFANIEIDAATGDATIIFDGIESGSSTIGGDYVIRYNSDYTTRGFSMYAKTATQYPLARLYAKAGSEPEVIEPYQMTYSYTQGTPAAKGARAAAATETTLAMEGATDNDINGIHNFTLTGVENVMGSMSVTIPDGENGQKLVGHNCEENYVETEFHQADGTAGCAEEHSPIVFVESNSPITLTHAESATALPITTNPNEYHGFYINHPKADVSVELNPFRSAKLTFIGEEIPTGIEGVATDTEAGEETFYNLQGVRVNKQNMMPGIYVRVVGTTATKVAVR